MSPSSSMPPLSRIQTDTLVPMNSCASEIPAAPAPMMQRSASRLAPSSSVRKSMIIEASEEYGQSAELRRGESEKPAVEDDRPALAEIPHPAFGDEAGKCRGITGEMVFEEISHDVRGVRRDRVTAEVGFAERLGRGAIAEYLPKEIPHVRREIVRRPIAHGAGRDTGCSRQQRNDGAPREKLAPRKPEAVDHSRIMPPIARR